MQELFEKYIKVFTLSKLPLVESEYENKGIQLDELGSIVSHIDEFISFVSESELTKDCIISKLCEVIVSFGLVHALKEEKEYNAEDFPNTAQNAESCFQFTQKLFSGFEDLEHTPRREILINSLILCATHSKLYLWSNENSVTLSKDFVNFLLLRTNHEDLMSLLCDEKYHPTLFKGVLVKLRPSLMKDSWMKTPSSCYIYSWFLHHVKHPHLTDYMPDIFPPPFMFISDYQVHHQIIGIQSFDHILDNVPPTLIKIDGKEDVIYHSLLPKMYSKDPEIIKSLFSCLLKLPSIKNQKMTDICWPNYDHILNHLIVTAEMEHKKELKHLYLSHIYSFVQVIPPFKHLKLLMTLIEKGLSNEMEHAYLITTLNILRKVIKSCWPRMKTYCFKIMKMVMILFYELEKQKDQPNIKDVQEIYSLCEDCLTLLKHSCEPEFERLAVEYVDGTNDLPGVEVLKTVLHKE